MRLRKRKAERHYSKTSIGKSKKKYGNSKLGSMGKYETCIEYYSIIDDRIALVYIYNEHFESKHIIQV